MNASSATSSPNPSGSTPITPAVWEAMARSAATFWSSLGPSRQRWRASSAGSTPAGRWSAHVDAPPLVAPRNRAWCSAVEAADGRRRLAAAALPGVDHPTVDGDVVGVEGRPRRGRRSPRCRGRSRRAGGPTGRRRRSPERGELAVGEPEPRCSATPSTAIAAAASVAADRCRGARVATRPDRACPARRRRRGAHDAAALLGGRGRHRAAGEVGLVVGVGPDGQDVPSPDRSGIVRSGVRMQR